MDVEPAREFLTQVVMYKPVQKRSYSQAIGPLDRGNAIVSKIKRLNSDIDRKSKYKSTRDQSHLFNLWLAGASKKIYGRDTVIEYEAEIKRKHAFLTLSQYHVDTLPRRSGKSENLGRFIATCLESIPDLKIIVIASSTRAAGGDSGLMQIVKRYLDILGVKKFVKSNEEALWVKGPNGKTNMLHCYPGGAVDKYEKVSQSRPRKRILLNRSQ